MDIADEARFKLSRKKRRHLQELFLTMRRDLNIEGRVIESEEFLNSRPDKEMRLRGFGVISMS